MGQTLEYLQAKFPSLTYRQGAAFCWSPETNEILYPRKHIGERSAWSLLHETSHALLGHRSYAADFELVRMEVMAWDKAKELAKEIGITIDEDHIQDCLDSYRDWVYARSICPRCRNKSLQQDDLQHYRCFNCHNAWRVTPSRFCRAYRATKDVAPALSQFKALQSL